MWISREKSVLPLAGTCFLDHTAILSGGVKDQAFLSQYKHGQVISLYGGSDPMHLTYTSLFFFDVPCSCLQWIVESMYCMCVTVCSVTSAVHSIEGRLMPCWRCKSRTSSKWFIFPTVFFVWGLQICVSIICFGSIPSSLPFHDSVRLESGVVFHMLNLILWEGTS